MGNDALFNGSLTPRAGKSEDDIEKALEKFEDYYKRKNEVGVLVYDVSGNNTYFKEDYNELAMVFDGQVDFVGENGFLWSLFLKDGKVIERTPFLILPTPEETAEQRLGRYIAENGLDPRKVLEGMPEFIAAKLWFKEDLVNKADEVGITEEAQKEILDRAIALIDKEQLEAITDSEVNAIEEGLKKALDEYREKLKEVV